MVTSSRMMVSRSAMIRPLALQAITIISEYRVIAGVRICRLECEKFKCDIYSRVAINLKWH